jgi:hypothetical protein
MCTARVAITTSECAALAAGHQQQPGANPARGC